MTKEKAQYIVTGPYCWGRGRTIEEARKYMKQNWPKGWTGTERTFEVRGKDITVWEDGRVTGPPGTVKRLA